jgi:hypothetical protein
MKTSRGRVPLLHILGTLLFIGITGGLGMPTLYLAYGGLRRNGFIVTDGIVEELSPLLIPHSHRGGYNFHASYAYVVAGRSYSGSRVGRFENVWSKEDKEQIMSTLKIGQHAIVKYNASDPMDSYLDVGDESGRATTAYTIAAFLALGPVLVTTHLIRTIVVRNRSNQAG